MSETTADYTKFRITHNHPKIGKGKLNALHPSTVKIAGLVTIDLTADVTLEDNVEISMGAVILTHRHHWRHSTGPRGLIQVVTAHPLIICEDAFIGINAMIIGVSRIGKGAIVGGLAKIKHDVGDYEIWDGNPAQKIGERRNGAL